MRLVENPHRGSGPALASPSVPGGQQLAQLVRPESEVAALAERLLAGVWVVESIGALPETFSGVAVTRSGRLFDARTGELSQAPAGGAERLLEELGRRDELVAASEPAVRDEAEARAAVERHGAAVAEADTARERPSPRSATRSAPPPRPPRASSRSRVADRAPPRGAPGRARGGPARRADSATCARSSGWPSGSSASARSAPATSRRSAPAPSATSRWPRDADRAAAALESAREAVAARRDALAQELEAGAAAGEETAAALKACAQEEAELQGRLKDASEAVTGAEVAAQQVRDAAADAERELNDLAGRLGLEPQPAAEPLPDEEREALSPARRAADAPPRAARPGEPARQAGVRRGGRARRGARDPARGPRGALAELEGLIKETDRRIREASRRPSTPPRGTSRTSSSTCSRAAAARCGWCTRTMGPRPGGRRRGRSRDEAPSRRRRGRGARRPGVEIEVTPPGKSTKRLSLLSGGEKSLVALAFMFAVFLARPCPFYILDEVEAALDDLNIDRFLAARAALLRPRPVHRRHPPEAHDGRRRHALRREHGRRRHLARGVPQAGRPARRGARLVVR